MTYENKLRRAALTQGLDALKMIMALDPKPGDKGTMICPKCGGLLRWSYPNEGVIRGACGTEHCLRFMS